jgi:integrase
MKIHSEDVNAEIVRPQIAKEKRYPLGIGEIRKILDLSSPIRKAIYLTLLSSGLRIQELCQLRKRDFILSHSRLLIHIPAKYTKTKQERITFVSTEAADYITPILQQKKDDQLVFSKNENSYHATLTEEVYFNKIREKASLTAKYSSRNHKITLHSFRGFFITRVEKVHEGLGHVLAGHDRYMQEYERYSEAELLEFYLKVEPQLIVTESVADKLRIKKLETEKSELEKIKAEIEEMKRDTRFLVWCWAST